MNQRHPAAYLRHPAMGAELIVNHFGDGRRDLSQRPVVARLLRQALHQRRDRPHAIRAAAVSLDPVKSSFL